MVMLAATARLAGDGFSGNIMQLAVGAAALSVSLVILAMAVEYIEPSSFGKAGLVLVALLGATALASKLMSPTDAKGFGMTALAISGSMIIMAVAVYMFDQMNVSVKSAALAAVTMLALAGAVALIGTVNENVQKGAISMIVIVATMALVPLVLSLYKDIQPEDLIMPGLVLGALTAAVWVVGQSSATVLKGAAAMAVMAGVVGLFPYAVKQYADIEWEDLGKPAAVLTGLTIAVAALGTSSVMVLAGAGAMAIVAGSIWAIGKSLILYAERSWEDLGKAAAVIGGLGAAVAIVGAAAPLMLAGAGTMIVMAGGLWALGKAYSSLETPTFDMDKMAEYTRTAAELFFEIGGPIDTPMIIAGSATAASIGLGLYSLAKGMKATEGIDMRSAKFAADQIMDWATQTIEKFSDISIVDMAKAKMGLWTLSKLGTTLTSLALGVSAMASGTYNEYGVKNGELQVIAVHRLTPADFAAVGSSIDNIVSAITEPLAKFGAGGGLITDSDTERGMESLSKIGQITGPIIEVSKNVKQLDKTDFKPFGRAVESLVTDLQKPLAKVSETGGWFSDNDYEKGFDMLSGMNKIIDPIVKISKIDPKALNTDPFIRSVTRLAAGIKKPFHEMSTLDSKAIGNMKIVSETAKAMEYIANADLNELNKFNDERRKAMFEKLDEVISAIKGVGSVSGTTTEMTTTQPTSFMDSLFGEEPKEPVTLETISEQIELLITAIQMKR
jgi:hypothetical protein